jgi:hypothetical protein
MKRSIKNMKKEYEAAVQQASIVAFIAVVRRHPEVTLGDLFPLIAEYGLEGLSAHRLFMAEDFMDFSSVKLKALPPAKTVSGAKKGAGTRLSLRTVKQREAYRLLVLDSTAVDWKSSPEIQSKTGGDPGQILRTLNSLIEEGLVEYKGQARGTKYKLTSKGERAQGK